MQRGVPEKQCIKNCDIHDKHVSCYVLEMIVILVPEGSV